MKSLVFKALLVASMSFLPALQASAEPPTSAPAAAPAASIAEADAASQAGSSDANGCFMCRIREMVDMWTKKARSFVVAEAKALSETGTSITTPSKSDTSN